MKWRQRTLQEDLEDALVKYSQVSWYEVLARGPDE